MRVLCLALVSAAALAASAHGLPAESDVALSLETAVGDRQQPLVEGKTERFLKSEEQDLPLAVTSADRATRLGQEDGVGGRLRSADSDFESFDEERKYKRRKKKQNAIGTIWKAIGKKIKRNKKKRNDDDVDSDETPMPTPPPDVDPPAPKPKKKSWLNWGW